MKNPNITVAPTVHSKGFKSENLKIQSVSADDLLVQKRLSNAKRELKQLSREDSGILATIEESYARHLNREPLLEGDFLLSGHERLEFDNLNDQQTVRYFLYRYKYNMYPVLK